LRFCQDAKEVERQNGVQPKNQSAAKCLSEKNHGLAYKKVLICIKHYCQLKPLPPAKTLKLNFGIKFPEARRAGKQRKAMKTRFICFILGWSIGLKK